MRHYFIVPLSVASKVVAVPLLFFVTFSYAWRLVNQHTTDVYLIAMTAFGVTAALSAICYTVPSSTGTFPPTRYAGEKFLHSSLLLIQTLMIVYVRDAATRSLRGSGHDTLSSVITGTLGILTFLICAAAAYAWFFGFEALNDELWSNWDRRLREMKTKKPKSTEAPAVKE